MRSNDGAWEQASLCRGRASVCGQAGSCSRVGKESEISCGAHCVPDGADSHLGSGIEDETETGPILSRTNGWQICVVDHRVEEHAGRQGYKNRGKNGGRG